MPQCRKNVKVNVENNVSMNQVLVSSHQWLRIWGSLLIYNMHIELEYVPQ